jgi:glutamate racemase
MRVGITDSGVGGLSVCAELETLLRHSPVAQDIEIFYLNAALRDDYSYNSMSSRGQKLEAFGSFLRNVTDLYHPDLLYIACNTLSVLFQDSHFDHYRHIPITGIVETGTVEILRALQRGNDTSIIVFATPTTIAEAAYQRRLVQAGIPAERIVQQACPGLPDAISNDFTGGQATTLLKTFIPTALTRFNVPPSRVAAFLGCTHYGYQAGLFKTILRERVTDVEILNPNPAASASIHAEIGSPSGSGAVEIRFISAYAVPEKPLASLAHYLGEKAPATVAALQGFIHDPDLYRV